MLNHEISAQTKSALLTLVKLYHEERRSLESELEINALNILDSFMQKVERDLNNIGLSLEGLSDE